MTASGIRAIQATAEHNLIVWQELVDLTITLKQAWLRRQHPDLTDDELTALVYQEICADKEAAWKTS